MKSFPPPGYFTVCVLLGCNALTPSRAQTGAPPLNDLPANPDAIVVGAGIAGLCAAWELAQGGAKVVVVDMASVFGGHAVMATGDLCMVGTPFQESQGVHDSPEIAYKDFVTWGEDPNLEWVRYYVDNSRREIYDWITGMGVKFERSVNPPGNSVWRMHRTKGRGLALVSPVYRACLDHRNITFVWNVRVERLQVKGGRICGVVATNIRTLATLELRAGAVVLATGGFQSNLDFVREFWPKSQTFPRNFLIGSGINSMGSGLEIAQKAGAAVSRLDHQWNYVTGLPDPRFPGTARGLNAYNNDSIWVNSDGRRFVAEKTSTKYSLRILLEQKGETYWSIFDEPTKRTFWVAGSNWSDFREIEKWIFSDPKLVKSAMTLGELAEKSGLPEDELTKTVHRFNEMVSKGVDEDFGRFGPGKPIQPKPIATPPFYAIQHFPITRKSMGGVVIDSGCRVQDMEQRTIPGLYAAGEVTGLAGINGKAGLEGTFLGPSIITGRVAGRTVLSDMGRTPGSGDVSAGHPLAAIKPDPLASTPLCLSCHDLPKLVTASRPGYWHFEKVHREVIAQKFDCAKCHSDMTATFHPEKHRINRLVQVESCTTCHKGEDR